MPLYRQTAIVNFVLPSVEPTESLPLTTEREFGVFLTINNQNIPASFFRSPVNDEQWRDFWRKVRSCNTNRSTDDSAKRDARAIRSIGLSLYQCLASLSPQLKAFLDRAGTPRRLVIQTMRPELHLLPWGALYDLGGNLLAAGDLSIVHAWDQFSDSVTVTQSRLDLLRVIGLGTNGATSDSVTKTLSESGVITLREADSAESADILHVEAHGDAVTQKIAGAGAASFAESCGQPKIALLWSCFSGAANSWGDSPALWLHRTGAVMVLSFQAELNVADASSVSEHFYGDVFGATASRDPESALVRIRTDKFTNEFSFANWASMTVYLRSPLDMSALPLNGPRTPMSGWVDDLTAGPAAAAAIQSDGPWFDVADKVHDLQPGNWKQMKMPVGADAAGKLPKSAFGGWRGNVIRLNGYENPLSDDVLRELDLLKAGPPDGDPAERLAWFFEQITHYGSPLIVWISCLPRHMEFLQVVEPDAAISFLLLTAPEQTDVSHSIPELVDLNRLEEARDKGEELLASGSTDDELLSAAYYASVRGEKPTLAARFLQQMGGLQEWLLLTGNLVSRDKKNVIGPERLEELGGRFIASDGGAAATGDVVAREEFDQLRKPEDYYRLAMNLSPAQMTPRENARAKHELAYLKQQQGRPGTAELLYRLALEDLGACKNENAGTMRDSRWRFAISAVLRDYADLLSDREDRLKDASALLKRAMAIQAFHGMQLQLGYSETTAAKIALTGDRHTRAIKLAVSASNRMEVCENWRGWSEALGILFDSLAETRETARMISLANLAGRKIREANLARGHLSKMERMFKFEKGRAHWIAGDLIQAEEELETVASDAADEDKSDMDREIDQLLAFMRVAKPTAEMHEP